MADIIVSAEAAAHWPFPLPGPGNLVAAGDPVNRPAPNTTQRLYWALRGPLASSVAVLDRPPREGSHTFAPFYDAATGAYHPIAALPVSEPRVSSMTIHVQLLQDWEDNWDNWHFQHSEPGMESEGCEWGVLGGEQNAEDVDIDSLVPLRCCGDPRPIGKDASLVVRASNAGDEDGGKDGSFISVRDYVTAVHPWLMNLRNDILGALGTLNGDDNPYPQSTPLFVEDILLNTVTIMTQDEWIHGKTVPEGLFIIYPP